MTKHTHPTLRFESSPEKDTATFFDFVHDAQYDGGRSLRWAVFDHFPDLERYFIQGQFIGKREDIETFVRTEHSRHAADISQQLVQYGTGWARKSGHFFDLVRDLFGGREWPEGKYVAYPTIWGMYPRFLSDKTFQIPFRGKMLENVNEIIAHELLHFMFYDYFYALLPQYAGEGHEMFSWHVTEIFNTVVQNSKPWRDAFPGGTLGYPEHEKIVDELTLQFPIISNENLTDFTRAIVKHVQESELPKDS